MDMGNLAVGSRENGVQCEVAVPIPELRCATIGVVLNSYIAGTQSPLVESAVRRPLAGPPEETGSNGRRSE